MKKLKCSKCNQFKELKMFSKKSNRKRGYSSHCKNCICIKKEGRPLLGKEGDPNYKAIEFDNGTKLCSTCKEVKSIIDFKSRNKYKKFPSCNDCHRKKIKTKQYNISVELYEKMLLEQNNLCKICKKPSKSGIQLAIDHDHTTGKVRGLLCTNCNIGLGFFKDNILILEETIRYLKSNS